PWGTATRLTGPEATELLTKRPQRAAGRCPVNRPCPATSVGSSRRRIERPIQPPSFLASTAIRAAPADVTLSLLEVASGNATSSPPPLAGEGQGGGDHMIEHFRLPSPHPSPASGGGRRPSLLLALIQCAEICLKAPPLVIDHRRPEKTRRGFASAIASISAADNPADRSSANGSMSAGGNE